MKSPPAFLPHRPLGARQAHRELRAGTMVERREAAMISSRQTDTSRGAHPPSWNQLAFTDPLPSDYYLG
jgi:hypothetical protein